MADSASFLNLDPSNHLERKLSLTKTSTALHSDYFQLSGHKANNKPTTMIPIPLPRSRVEVTLTKEYRVFNPDIEFRQGDE